jgi:hypothetical protein
MNKFLFLFFFLDSIMINSFMVLRTAKQLESRLN